MHSKNKPEDTLKNWPQFLVFQALVKKHSLPVESSLILSRDGRKCEPVSQDPYPLLIDFLDYYFQSHEHPSPLIPDWTNALIKLDSDALDDQISSSLNNSSKELYNDYIKWMVRGNGFPLSGSWLDEWKSVAESAFGEMLRVWHPKKTPKDAQDDE